MLRGPPAAELQRCVDQCHRHGEHVHRLEQELKRDRSPSKVLSINEFGLVIITRKRVKQSLERLLCQTCPYCTGSGLIKSVTTVCSEIYDEVKKYRDEYRAQNKR